MDIGSAVGRATGVTEAQLRDLAHYQESPAFSALNQTTRDWYSRRPALKHRAQATKETEVPSEPGLPGFVL